MTAERRRDGMVIGVIFVISVCLRFALGCYYPRTVNCYPDELLYLSAAESLWNNHTVMVYNLPSNFGKIGYALLLAPLFSIGDIKVRMYAVAFVNSFVISLGVFPVYALAKRILQKNTCVILSVCFYAASSTMTYAMTYTSEVLFIPLMLWLVYLLYRLLTEEMSTRQKAGLIALIVPVWLLAYLTKELALVVPVALVMYFVVQFFARRGQIAGGRKVFVGLVILAVACIGLYTLSNAGTEYYQLGFDWTLLRERMWYLLYGFVFYLVTTVIAFLFVPILYPVVFCKNMDEKARRLCLFLVCLLVATAATVSYTIYMYEDYPSLTPRAHIRYVEYAFVPFLILLFHLLEQKKEAFCLRRVLLLAVCCGVVLLCFSGFNGQTIDNTMLFFMQVFTEDGHVFLPYKARLLTLLLILVVAILTYLFYNNSKYFIIVLLSGLSLVTLGNNVLSTYIQYKTHTHSGAEAAETWEVRALVLEHSEDNFVILEPQNHSEMLDTYLVDCDNVRVLTEGVSWYYALTGGDLEQYGLWADGSMVQGSYEAPQRVQYLLLYDAAYAVDEGAHKVASYPTIGYSLYRLDDDARFPEIRMQMQ